MKIPHCWVVCLCLFFAGAAVMTAQDLPKKTETDKATQVQRHTVMEKFAPDISLTAEERQQKRLDRMAEIEFRRRVLDTLDIPERRRLKLLLDLKYNPFSDRLNRTMAEIKFEDDDGIDD
ncbi:hypothetical protein FK220_011665 [Flavobacteriaceae bacterium TP-CH-4]|uniref:LTXXQ motif family protein n=1 Tax=Pelagihabitans pacificus TaxID=2696054 RepID=A0A967EE45_9FLAO|nr:hypothetical protein [Pelagihabitans pacificus]NHF60003.1 hypothetical protein [Pelagihabitans pacificus]